MKEYNHVYVNKRLYNVVNFAVKLRITIKVLFSCYF